MIPPDLILTDSEREKWLALEADGWEVGIVKDRIRGIRRTGKPAPQPDGVKRPATAALLVHLTPQEARTLRASEGKSHWPASVRRTLGERFPHGWTPERVDTMKVPPPAANLEVDEDREDRQRRRAMRERAEVVVFRRGS